MATTAENLATLATLPTAFPADGADAALGAIHSFLPCQLYPSPACSCLVYTCRLLHIPAVSHAIGRCNRRWCHGRQCLVRAVVGVPRVFHALRCASFLHTVPLRPSNAAMCAALPGTLSGKLSCLAVAPKMRIAPHSQSIPTRFDAVQGLLCCQSGACVQSSRSTSPCSSL